MGIEPLQAAVTRATSAIATYQAAEGTPSEDLRLPLLKSLLGGTAGALRSLVEGELDLVAQAMGAASGAEALPRPVAPPLASLLEGPPSYCLPSVWDPGMVPRGTGSVLSAQRVGSR